MCLGVPARVIAVDAAAATVEDHGRRRRVSILPFPDLTPGEWVLVAAGMAVRRLDPTDAAEPSREIDRAEARARGLVQGGQS